MIEQVEIVLNLQRRYLYQRFKRNSLLWGCGRIVKMITGSKQLKCVCMQGTGQDLRKVWQCTAPHSTCLGVLVQLSVTGTPGTLEAAPYTPPWRPNLAPEWPDDCKYHLGKGVATGSQSNKSHCTKTMVMFLLSLDFTAALESMFYEMLYFDWIFVLNFAKFLIF